MGETYVCDSCDSRIENGYTVAWCKRLTDNGAGVHYSRTDETRNLCSVCWPTHSKPLTDRVRDMLGF